MEVSDKLKKLATSCDKQGHRLYIVGGYVRDSIIGNSTHDIDICSNILPDDMITIAHKLKLKAHLVNKNLGTVHIGDEKESYEYTPFRTESYGTPGTHTPEKVEFVDDINTDYLRRDITINSIYYDILSGKIIDPANGRMDIDRHLIRTTNIPRITLNDDGVRILRIIRFASMLDYKISASTLSSMKKYRNRLTAISKERVVDELHKCVTADLKYNSGSTALIDNFNRLHLIPIIFGHKTRKVKRLNKKEKSAYYTLPEHARLIGLYSLVIHKTLFTYLPHKHLAYYVNLILGHDGLKESGSHIRACEKILLISENLNYKKDEINASINYLLSSTSERCVIDLCLNKKAKALLSDNILYIKDKKLPLGVHELNTTPQELIESGIEEKYISRLLVTLYNLVLNLKIANEKQVLIDTALQIHNQFKNIQNNKGSTL